MLSCTISNAVIKRMPRYYRYLRDLSKNHVERISSLELSQLMHTTPSQVRQDFNIFGGFGQQGYGYHVQTLCEEIKNVIGVEQCSNMIIIGAGNMGQALINYTNFPKLGFDIQGVFDINPKICGLIIHDLEVQPIDQLENFLRDHQIQIAALTLPRDQAQAMADRLVSAGIKAIWNFAPIDLNLPKGVVVENIHLAESLMQLAFRCNHMI